MLNQSDFLLQKLHFYGEALKFNLKGAMALLAPISATYCTCIYEIYFLQHNYIIVFYPSTKVVARSLSVNSFKEKVRHGYEYLDNELWSQ